jgi:microcystin-dependent protein
MSDQFLAEIRLFACNFAPIGWATCSGQILPISQNTALFSLLGTNYGGDGRSTFALPNLQGALPVAQGQGAGLSLYDLGETGGSPNVTLLATEMPSHSHTLNADKGAALSASPSGAIYMKGNFSSGGTSGPVQAYKAQTPTTQMAANAIGPAGGSQPHNNLMPYLALNYCIALQGIYPPRS